MINTKNNHVKHWDTRGRNGGITVQGYKVHSLGPRINPVRKYEHRTILEEKIGRKLNSNEVAHHINGNKLDNRPENLELMTKAEHSRMHAIEKGLGKKYRPKIYANQSRTQLSEEEIGLLVSLFEEGHSGVEISKEMNIATSTVSKYKGDICR